MFDDPPQETSITTSVSSNISISNEDEGRSNNQPPNDHVDSSKRKRRKFDLSLKDRKKLKEEQVQVQHLVLPPCQDCKKGCVNEIDENQRQKINSQFWNSSWTERNTFMLNSCVRCSDVKRRTTKNMVFDLANNVSPTSSILSHFQCSANRS
ncbi:hypothetical protein J6590_023578 [Homalodisca vitripennis]|nr:hypothetical protein J6590_023578 [Homalodisca vitripennis]